MGLLRSGKADTAGAGSLDLEPRVVTSTFGGLFLLSTALETPALSIFGKAHPAWWSPGSAFPGKRHLYKDPQDRAPGAHFGIGIDEALFAAAVPLMEGNDGAVD